MKRKIYLALCIIFAIVFIGSSAAAGLTMYKYKQADDLYGDLQESFVVPSTPDNQEPQQETAPISVDFDELLKKNKDVIGWLYCENTPINYPVVQSGDNDKYLRRDLNGKYLANGTLFADFRCSAAPTDQINIIYGHNMKNASMFGTLVKYDKQKYYNEHPILYYLTPDRDYKIELFCGYTTDANDDIYQLEARTTEEFEVFLQEIKEKSAFSSDVSVTGDDKVVMLSTCSYKFNNARYVLFGKLTGLSSKN